MEAEDFTVNEVDGGISTIATGISTGLQCGCRSVRTPVSSHCCRRRARAKTIRTKAGSRQDCGPPQD